MANFDHSKPIDLRKSKQTQENQVYNTETWMPELVTFDIVADPGITFAEYVAEQINTTQCYADYIAEQVTTLQTYAEYHDPYKPIIEND